MVLEIADAADFIFKAVDGIVELVGWPRFLDTVLEAKP